MNRLSKILYPEAFHTKYIRTHWDFESELKDLLERSGQKADFCGKYKLRLRFLDERKGKCTFKRDWFEKLKKANKLYSIKFKDEKNIRIIFSFIEYRGCNYALLLHAFEEKDDKNKSRYSYDGAIPVAQQRLKEVLEIL